LEKEPIDLKNFLEYEIPEDLSTSYSKAIKRKYAKYVMNFSFINTFFCAVYSIEVWWILVESGIVTMFPFYSAVSVMTGPVAFWFLYLRYGDYFRSSIIKRVLINPKLSRHVLELVIQSFFILVFLCFFTVSLYVFVVGSSESLGLDPTGDLSKYPSLIVIIFFILGISFVTLSVQEALKYVDRKLTAVKDPLGESTSFFEDNIDAILERNEDIKTVYDEFKESFERKGILSQSEE